MTKTISLYVSGLVSEKEAEDELDQAQAWFRSAFDPDKYTVATSIKQGPYGWKMEMNAVEEA